MFVSKSKLANITFMLVVALLRQPSGKINNTASSMETGGVGVETIVELP